VRVLTTMDGTFSSLPHQPLPLSLSLHTFPQPDAKLLIGGKFLGSTTADWIDVHDPVRV